MLGITKIKTTKINKPIFYHNYFACVYLSLCACFGLFNFNFNFLVRFKFWFAIQFNSFSFNFDSLTIFNAINLRFWLFFRHFVDQLGRNHGLGIGKFVIQLWRVLSLSFFCGISILFLFGRIEMNFNTNINYCNLYK